MKLILLSAVFFCASVNAQHKSTIIFKIHTSDTIQRIRNFGAAACWYGEEIGKDWPSSQKQRIAELLFSREFDKQGQPKGIGLSAFRYNIGAGSAEQGDSSGIKDPSHRVECFLSPDGSYNWNKQPGYTWLLTQAKKFGVQDLIAFVNSPPVQFTKNGYAFKLEKDYVSNLKEDKYEAYAKFLGEVLKQFDSKGLHFNYISPINEPQWDWTGVPGQAKQEGTPYTNEEIFKVISAVSKTLSNERLQSKILATEAATIDHLTAGTGKAANQISTFWNPSSQYFIGNLANTTPYVEGHGYFTENGDRNLLRARNRVRDTLKTYAGLEFWQSEYCMLGDGYKDGSKEQRIPAIDCALFLAKVIHHDLTSANATAWHYWNSFEPGSADFNTRYYLFALGRDRKVDTMNLFTVTKNLWALGHYSLLIRPGMQRVLVERNDSLADTAIAQDIMVSAFRDSKNKQMIVNLINYTKESRKIRLQPDQSAGSKKWKLVRRYQTTATEGENMKPYVAKGFAAEQEIELPARSVTSMVLEN